MRAENESNLAATSKPRALRAKRVDLILAAALMAAVLVFSVRHSPGKADISHRALTKAGIKNAGLAGFNYETTEGFRYYKAKEYAKAEQAFRKSIAYSPDDAVGYNNLGNVLNDQRKWDEATRFLRRALELDPDFALAKNNLAWVEAHKASAANGRR
jgi:tetratricopeptide (TPR) repeat protein